MLLRFVVADGRMEDGGHFSVSCGYSAPMRPSARIRSPYCHIRSSPNPSYRPAVMADFDQRLSKKLNPPICEYHLPSGSWLHTSTLILLDLPASPKRLSAGYSFSAAREARLPWQSSKVLGVAGTAGSTQSLRVMRGAEDSALATC